MRVTGDQVRAGRERMGLTQLQIAGRFGLTTRTWMRWEKHGTYLSEWKWYSGSPQRVARDELVAAINATIRDPAKSRDSSSSSRHVTSTSRPMSRDAKRSRNVTRKARR